MKFGVREICDVVLRAKAAQKIGNKIFYKNEPVIYFDTLKTSSMEGAATTVYAQGGRGNSRLVAWEGERTVTFTMEDALISPEGFMILSGAGLVEANANNTIKQHMTETIDAGNTEALNVKKDVMTITLSKAPYVGPQADGDFIFVMLVKDGEIISEPIIPDHGAVEGNTIIIQKGSRFNHIASENCIEKIPAYYKDASGNTLTEAEYAGLSESDKVDYTYVPEAEKACEGYKLMDISTASGADAHDCTYHAGSEGGHVFLGVQFDSVLVDYYVEHKSGARQIEITADKFGGNYYLEASTLFRNQNGVDMPAEFIIPNCKIQSNFTFSMASSGDPSTFTFTMDAFPDYTRFDHSKKVLAAIQIIEEASAMDLHRHSTVHETAHDALSW